MAISKIKNPDGTIKCYQIRVYNGTDPITGKKIAYPSTTFYPSPTKSDKTNKKDLEQFAFEYEQKCRNGEILTKAERKAKELDRIKQGQRDLLKPTFNQYIDSYIKEKAITRKLGTVENYKNALDRASKVFGDIKMADITYLQVKDYITDLQSNGRNEKNGKPLAHTSIIRHYIVLHTFFENAVDNEIIPSSPMLKMKRPKKRHDEVSKEPIVYDEKQVRYIIECLNQEPLKWKALVLLLIDSGCRRGEAVGLMWKEIDFASGEVNICRNAQYTSSIGTHISTPKNRKSRKIYLNRTTLTILAQWKKEQRLLLFKQGLPNTGFCFTGDNGKLLIPQAPTSYLERFGKKYNLEGIHPHALRHTMATITIANGGDVVSVSNKLGHADPSITLKVYSHANEEAQKRANEVLANAIYKNIEQA